MARLLFRLTHVPDDEAQDVRTLLTTHDIHFYETDAGFWRVGVDALWLPNDNQYSVAKNLIDAYQLERTEQQQQYYLTLKEQGLLPSVWQTVSKNFLKIMGVIFAIIFLLGFLLLPFVFLKN